MVSVTIVYFSSSGDTERIAKLLAADLRRRGRRVLLTELDEARHSDLSQAEVILVGSPAWSGEAVAPPMVDFLTERLDSLRGKRVAFFGSYDWGDGRYFDRLAEDLRRQGIQVHRRPLLSQAGREPSDSRDVAEFLDELLGKESPPAG